MPRRHSTRLRRAVAKVSSSHQGIDSTLPAGPGRHRPTKRKRAMAKLSTATARAKPKRRTVAPASALTPVLPGELELKCAPAPKKRRQCKPRLTRAERISRFEVKLQHCFGHAVQMLGPRAVVCTLCPKKLRLGDEYGISNIRIHFGRRHPGVMNTEPVPDPTLLPTPLPSRLQPLHPCAAPAAPAPAPAAPFTATELSALLELLGNDGSEADGEAPVAQCHPPAPPTPLPISEPPTLNELLEAMGIPL